MPTPRRSTKVRARSISPFFICFFLRGILRLILDKRAWIFARAARMSESRRKCSSYVSARPLTKSRLYDFSRFVPRRNYGLYGGSRGKGLCKMMHRNAAYGSRDLLPRLAPTRAHIIPNRSVDSREIMQFARETYENAARYSRCAGTKLQTRVLYHSSSPFDDSAVADRRTLFPDLTYTYLYIRARARPCVELR